MLAERQRGGFHLAGPLGLTEKASGEARLGAGRGFLLQEAPVIATTEDTLLCLLAPQTQCKMWFRCWRNSTWRRRGVPWRSSDSCMSGSWNSSASSCPRSGSPRAAALASRSRTGTWALASRNLLEQNQIPVPTQKAPGEIGLRFPSGRRTAGPRPRRAKAPCLRRGR